MSSDRFETGRGAGRRQSYHPPILAAGRPPAVGPEAAAAAVSPAAAGAAVGPAAAAAAVGFPVQATQFVPQNWPFQHLPAPNGVSPFRYDLSRLLSSGDVQEIVGAGTLVLHAVGDTGDYRGQQQDFVAALMTADADELPDGRKPAFFYHLGDVVYFAGDIDRYGANFYETYKTYPSFIVSISGNHDCQPDDPQDGPVSPGKVAFDGWVQNFMSPDSSRLGSMKTGSGRTQLDLPNAYWTFTTPFATIIGMCSNVGETEGEFHQDQLDWFKAEVAAADRALALVVAVHHPPFSGDTEHSGSTRVFRSIFDIFSAVGRYPNLILSGHVHNYQRFTYTVRVGDRSEQVACVVAGAGGYTKLGKIHKIRGKYPTAPLQLGPDLRLEQYDQENFGFLRLEISKAEIVGSYISAPFSLSGEPQGQVLERFSVNLTTNSVTTLPG